MPHLCLLEAEQAPYFPPIEQALSDPNGLLAIGGKLTPDWLLCAYKNGIFPWFGDGEPIMWWSPAPRMVLQPGKAHVSKSVKKQFRKAPIEIKVNYDFTSVIDLCSDNPIRQEGTWITDDMMEAYIRLHNEGWAHSFEVWRNNNLIGGLYGVGIGDVFYGESMFSLAPGASKYAFIALSEASKASKLRMVDCQLHNPFLESLGAGMLPKEAFKSKLPKSLVRLNLVSDEKINQLLQEKMASGS